MKLSNVTRIDFYIHTHKGKYKNSIVLTKLPKDEEVYKEIASLVHDQIIEAIKWIDEHGK